MKYGLTDETVRLRGRVAFLNPEKHYGFIQADIGPDVYFNFKELFKGMEIAVGTLVEFTLCGSAKLYARAVRVLPEKEEGRI